MNNIDQKFYHLLSILKNSSKEEIYHTIKTNYDFLSESLKDSIEEYFRKFPYWGALDHRNGIYEQIEQKAISFNEHLEDYRWLYENLSDYRSKKLLYAIMNNWYQYDFLTLSTSHEKNFPHYFDLDIVTVDQHEVFVDLGAYIGDTILDYLQSYGENQYQKIYGYEITESSFEQLIENTKQYPNIIPRKKAVLDKPGTVYFQSNSNDFSANQISEFGEQEIVATSLDQDILEPITMIKMDIEGTEQKALLGAQHHIEKEHPKLLLSVYHNNEDIWKIPRMIEQITSGYRFYLRSYGGDIYPTEIVLLAIYNSEKKKCFS